ncbi:hypothetical protein CESP606_08410 [Cereibacter sphaeroides]|jgi:hypothetical protein
MKSGVGPASAGLTGPGDDHGRRRGCGSRLCEARQATGFVESLLQVSGLAWARA